MSRQGSPVIEVRGLVAGYGPEPILDGLDLVLEPGRKILLLGPNGAGKTTLLRCILGLLPARSGSVRLWGEDPSDPRSRGSLIARCGVGLEAPRNALKVTALEWTLFHARLAGCADPDTTARRTLELWDLPADRLVEDLSLGERQRLETSRALLHEPRLLVLDEPTAHLDPGARDRFWTCLDAWCDSRGAGVLVSTHQLEEAADRGDEWMVLGRGRILHRGTSDSFLEAFPCSRRLILAKPLATEVLQDHVDRAVAGARVRAGSDARSVYRLETPRGRQDLPAIAEGLSREGIRILGLGEDSTSFREAYALCLGDSPPAPPSDPSGAERRPSTPRQAVAASFRLHALGLVRERRLVIPFLVMLGILLAALAWLPGGGISVSLLALGAVLPGGLAAGLSADLVAGERDRRYLETSLSLPVGFSRLVLGRALAILAFTTALSWLALATLVVSGGGLVEALAIAIALSPGSMALCVCLGTWISMRSRSLRTAAQFSTLASLPLIVLAQGLPLLLQGRLLPWLAGGAALLAGSSILAPYLLRQLQPRKLPA